MWKLLVYLSKNYEEKNNTNKITNYISMHVVIGERAENWN